MVIKEIKIANFGAVKSFEASFNSNFNLLNVGYVKQVAAAISFLLCLSDTVVPNKWIKQNTCISAKAIIDKQQYFIKAEPDKNMFLNIKVTDAANKEQTKKYKYLLSHCAEQDSVNKFDKSSCDLPFKLCWYNDREKYDFGNLTIKTNGIADTKFFRRYLNNYIKDFDKNAKNVYSIRISKFGKLQNVNAGKTSKKQEKMFLYNCFFMLAEFWEELEKIRDINYESKPLIVESFIKENDCDAQISKMQFFALQTNKQVIVLA